MSSTSVVTRMGADGVAGADESGAADAGAEETGDETPLAAVDEVAAAGVPPLLGGEVDAAWGAAWGTDSPSALAGALGLPATLDGAAGVDGS